MYRWEDEVWTDVATGVKEGEAGTGPGSRDVAEAESMAIVRQW